jgi:hypothetical protein
MYVAASLFFDWDIHSDDRYDNSVKWFSETYDSTDLKLVYKRLAIS